MAKIAVVYGSVREKRQGIKAARFIMNKLKERGHDATLIDPLERPLPLLVKEYADYEPGEAPPSMQEISRIFEESDGYIIVSGEYNHSIPPALKNILDHFHKEYHFKPAGLVTYSSGPFAGMRVMVHLRAVLAELGMITCRATLPISHIRDAFDESGKALDEAYERMAERLLQEFEWYVDALGRARAAGPPG